MIVLESVFHWLKNLPDIAQAVIVISAFIGAALGIYKKVYLPVSRQLLRFNSGLDTLLGYPAVHDPGTGRELQAATPPLANRVFTLEETNRDISQALTKLADNQEVLAHIQEEMEARKKVEDQFRQDFQVWQARVDSKLATWVSEQDALAAAIHDSLEETEGED